MIRSIENVNIYNIKRVQVRLTNAEILTLFTAPITLIPARMNIAWFPLMVQIVSETTAAIYATATNVLLGVPGSLGLWDSISLTNYGLDSGTFTVGHGTDIQHSFSEFSYPVSNIANLPLILSADANPTGGDPSNYAVVTVHYIEIEV